MELTGDAVTVDPFASVVRALDRARVLLIGVWGANYYEPGPHPRRDLRQRYRTA